MIENIKKRKQGINVSVLKKEIKTLKKENKKLENLFPKYSKLLDLY